MQVDAGGIALEVEVDGPPAGEPLLLVMGLGMQLVAWPDGFVEQLGARGFRVVRIDNRDAGLSRSYDDAGVPDLAVLALRRALRLPLPTAYTLADMADDAAAALAALGIASAHVCGASMGGMVAQHLAARHPGRVRSLCLMMTTGGARGLPGPTWRVRAAALAKPWRAGDLDAIVAHYRRFFRIIGSPAFPTPPEEIERQALRAVRRSWRPAGTLRQLVAIAADGDRSPLLAKIAAPTRVVHGSADPMLPPASAHDLVAKIAGADLDLVEGMGHDLPQALWPRLADDIAAVAARAAVRSDARASAGRGPVPSSAT